MSAKAKIAKTPLIIVTVIAIIWLLYLLIKDFWPEINLLIHYNSASESQLITMVRSHGLRDMVFLILVTGMMGAIPGLSNSVICIFAGLCYGPWLGLLLNWTGNILGNSTVTALIKRLSFSKKFKQNKLLKRLMEHDHPEVGLTIGYMVPVIPTTLINYSCAQLGIPPRKYLPMVMAGTLPMSTLYAFGGDAIFKGSWKRLIVIVLAIGGLILLRQVVVRKRRERAAS